MANSLIKGLALTLGGGLAVGLGIKIGQSATPPPSPQEAVDFGPVLDRIEGVESRIVNVETSHAATQAAIEKLTEVGPMVIPSVQELEARVFAQSNEVESLRAAIQDASQKGAARINDLGYAVSTLESRIPGLIDQSIKPKFDELHDRVQREMAETASQTLEVFADRIQARVVEKITSIEGDLTRQSEAINDLRDYSLKTDQNLQRLLAGVESLADKINRKFDAPAESARSTPPARPAPLTASPQVPPAGGVSSAPPAATPAPIIEKPPPAAPPKAQAAAPVAMAATPALAAPAPAPVPAPKPMNLVSPVAGPVQKAPDFPAKIELGEATGVRPLREAFPTPAPKPFSGPEFEDLLRQSPRSNGLRKAALAGGGLALFAMVGLGVEVSGVLSKPSVSHAASNPKTQVPTSGGDALDTKKLTDQSEMLDKAREFSQKHDFAKAEEIYRAILSKDPSNTEVKRLLASALYRQEKIDESVKVLNSISEDKQANNSGNEAPQ